jgi:hypothetical protein
MTHITIEKEKIELALEALNNSVDLVVEDAYNAEKLYGNYPSRQAKVGGLKVLAENHKEAIKALEEALASEQEQRSDSEQLGEPVAWISHNAGLYHFKPDESLDPMPLYTTPQQRTWVKLTKEEIKECFTITPDQYLTWHIYKRIEAKLRSKNT